MSQGFLPSVLHETDRMAERLGQHIETLKVEFINYCKFELLETAITSVFSTMRSGSNEVFLRTSFQYSKANLRKQLLSYFEEHEVRPYDLKSRKKKDLWVRLIKEKKQRLLWVFGQKKAVLNKDDAHLPPLLQDNNSSCSSGSVTNTMPPIDWKESVSHRYTQNQALVSCAPYPSSITTAAKALTMFTHHHGYYYGHHRQCTDCNLYINKMNQLLQENKYLKQMNRQYVIEREQWRSSQNYNSGWNGAHPAYFQSTDNSTVHWL